MIARVGVIDLNPELLEKLLNQGVGLTFGVALLSLYVWRERRIAKQLTDLLRERKADRDAMLHTLGKISGYLERNDAFETFARDHLRWREPK